VCVCVCVCVCVECECVCVSQGSMLRCAVLWWNAGVLVSHVVGVCKVTSVRALAWE
jgi:hypothetical protein